jgi:flagellar biosynthesis/type III secretory pathway protein FliH
MELQRWARFLRCEDERELNSLASETPIMADAKHALEILSREPTAQQIAELRREAEVETRWERMVNRAEGKAEGRVEGRAEGREQGLAEGREQGREEFARGPRRARPLGRALRRDCSALARPRVRWVKPPRAAPARK